MVDVESLGAHLVALIIGPWFAQTSARGSFFARTPAAPPATPFPAALPFDRLVARALASGGPRNLARAPAYVLSVEVLDEVDFQVLGERRLRQRCLGERWLRARGRFARPVAIGVLAIGVLARRPVAPPAIASTPSTPTPSTTIPLSWATAVLAPRTVAPR